jgi:hypothetical protein
MELTLEKARDLFDKGQFSGLSQASGIDFPSLKLLPPELRVLVAHASVYTGRVQLAADLADSVRQTNAAPSVIAKSHVVSGLIRKRQASARMGTRSSLSTTSSGRPPCTVCGYFVSRRT